MKRLKLLQGSLLVVFLLLFPLVSFANSDIIAYDLSENLRNQYSSLYNPPFVSSHGGSNIDEITGSLVYNEVDLHLPGKNGLDVNISRRYNSQKSDNTAIRIDGFNSYGFSNFEGYGYPYTATINGVVKHYKIFFSTETEMISKGYTEIRLKSQPSTSFVDANGVLMYNYFSLDKSSTGSIVLYRNHQLSRTRARFICAVREVKVEIPSEQQMEFGWSLSLPKFDITYDVLTSISRDIVATFEDDSGGKYVARYYADFFDNYENGYHENGYLEDNNQYTLEIYRPKNPTYEAEHELGFYYKYILKHNSGKTFYFRYSGLIGAITDKYENSIIYQHEINHLRKIVDSFGREINVTRLSGGDLEFRVTDGTKVKTVYYDFDIEYNPGDPANHVICDDTLYLRVYKNEIGENDITTSPSVTTYEMNANDFCYDYWEKPIYYYEVKKTTYPTGLTREYNYSTRRKKCLPGNMLYYVYVNAVSDYVEKSSEESITHTYSYANSFSDNRIGEKTIDFPDSFIYTTTISNSANNIRYERLYDKYDRLSKSIVYESNNKKSEQILSYRSVIRTSKIKSVETKQYKTNALSFSSITSYTYDSRDNLLTENDGTYSATYTYDPEYDMMLTKTYLRDTGKTIKIKNELTEDKKSVDYTETYENDVIKTKTNFIYDDYGNVIEKISSPNGTDNIVTRFDYIYSNGGVTITTTAEDVEDNDENFEDYSTVQVYDYFGNPVSTTDANENTVTMEYDVLGRITKQTNPDDTSIRISYNTAGNYLIVTNENGTKMKYQYTPKGQLSEVLLYENSWKELEGYNYDMLGRETKFTQYRTYDGINPDEKYSRETKYDWANRPIEIMLKDKANQTLSTTNMAYEINPDVNNRPLTKISIQQSGDEHITPAKIDRYYDYRNLLLSETLTDVNNNNNFLKTEYTYDIMGNVKTVKSPRYFAENWTEYTAQYNYDYAGNVVSETDANGNAIAYDYDKMGRRISFTDKEANTTNYYYDEMSRLIRTTAPFSGTKTTTQKMYYDGNSNLIKTKQQNVLEEYDTIEYLYDSRNRLAAEKGFPSPSTTSYTQYAYDGVGNILRMYTGLTSPIDTTQETNLPEGCAMTQYYYNALNQASMIIDATGEYELYAYDYAGNITVKRDRNSVLTSYEYNVYNKPTVETKRTSGNPNHMLYTVYTYDILGNTKQISRDNNNISYDYDCFGRLESETSNGITKKYALDSGGNVASLTVKNSLDSTLHSLEYNYTKLNMYDTLSSNGITTTYSYDSNGRLTGMSNNDGDSTTYQRNKAGLITYIENNLNNKPCDSSWYEYYLNGNVSSKRGNYDDYDLEAIYQYDGLGRLKRELAYNTGANSSFASDYLYDERNNIKTKTFTDYNSSSNTHTMNYTYDINNKLLKEEKTKGQTSEITDYFYDLNGRTTAKAKSFLTTGTQAEEYSLEQDSPYCEFFEYNAYGQLTEYETADTKVQYGYDPAGLRTSKIVNGLTTNLVNDRGSVILETDSSFTVEMKHVRGYNLLQSVDYNGYKKKYTYNAHGDVTYVSDGTVPTKVNKMNMGYIPMDLKYDTNGDGDIDMNDVNYHHSNKTTDIYTYNYDAFGVQLNTNDSDTNPFRYCGEYTDLSSGLIYLRNRYYEPSVGRFITEDPIRSGMNWYIYASNNPVNKIDPWGLVDRFLTELVDETTGSYSWSGKTRMTTVTIDGTTKYYKIVDGQVYYSDKKGNTGDKVGYIQNDKMVVDDEVFYSAFDIVGTVTIAAYYSPDEAFYIPGTEIRADWFSGHSFIGYTPLGGSIDTYATHPAYEQYGTEAGMHKNHTADRNLIGSGNTAKYSKKITQNQQTKMSNVINDPKNNAWSEINNCTPFAVKVFDGATGQYFPVFTPRALYNSISWR